MLTVTEPAVARLAQLLADSTYDFAVRIVRQNGRLKLRRDHRRAGDTTFDDKGRVVLVLDNQMSRALASRTLDVRETREGPRLRLKRP